MPIGTPMQGEAARGGRFWRGQLNRHAREFSRRHRGAR